MLPVVIIDDCALTTAILKSIAGARGERPVFPFTEVNPALDFLRETRAGVICVDYTMPDMDGITLTREIRARTLNSATPIVMLTGAEDPSVNARALEAGATAFLKKPVRLPIFKALLGRILPVAAAPDGLHYADAQAV